MHAVWGGCIEIDESRHAHDYRPVGSSIVAHTLVPMKECHAMSPEDERNRQHSYAETTIRAHQPTHSKPEHKEHDCYRSCRRAKSINRGVALQGTRITTQATVVRRQKGQR